MYQLPTSTQFVRCHNSRKGFNYQLAIDWAVDMIRNGNETESILIVAACSVSDDRYMLSRYVSTALRELQLEEYDEETAIRLHIQFHVVHILMDNDLRGHLLGLYRIAMETNLRDDLRSFYFLQHGWKELDDNGVDMYYETTKETVKDDVMKEARIWYEEFAVIE